jgi:hypothetical protein
MHYTAFLLTPALTGCPKDGPTSDEQVCCESFGYGAMMVKCCESYEWTTRSECAVPEQHVGGGKQVVEAGKCGGAPK